MRIDRRELTIELRAPKLRIYRGPYEAQRQGVAMGHSGICDVFGPIRTRRRDAIADAEHMGPDTIVRNTRNGAIVWRSCGGVDS